MVRRLNLWEGVERRGGDSTPTTKLGNPIAIVLRSEEWIGGLRDQFDLDLSINNVLTPRWHGVRH